MRELCLVLLIFSGLQPSESRTPRSAEELTNCVQIAEPLIHNPNYVFPLAVQEIRTVCQKWGQFVKCIRRYTEEFLTRSQQTEFNNAINSSMQSIHQLCIQEPKYEKAYLYYAPCMKKISIEDAYCGQHYNFLAKIAESPTETGPAICCGYHKFRSCVLREASKECDRDDDPTRPSYGNNSSHFVSSMLNRALGFLLQKCSDYEPTTQDCLSYMTASNKKNTNILSTFGISDVNDNGQDRGRDGRLSDFTPNDSGDFRGNDIGERKYPEPPKSNRPNPSAISNGNPFSSSSSSSGKYKPPVTVYPDSDAGTNRFTWTTATPSFFPTRNSSINFGNSIREPESQEFKGSGASSPSQAALLLISGLISTSLSIAINSFTQNCFIKR